MANYFVFEDHESSPVSQLLLASINGSCFKFSGGVSRLHKTVQEGYNEKDNYYVLLDVVPNNPITIDWYRKLKKSFKGYSNVFLLPIVCIEYYVLHMLVTYGYIPNSAILQGVVFDFDASVVKAYVGTIGCKESLEKVCKNIVSSLADLCKRNTNKSDNNIYGLFYREDCICDRKFCKEDCNDSLKLKAERLYCSLPLFDVVDDKHKEYLSSVGISTTTVSYVDVFDRQKKLYDDISRKLGLVQIMF